MNKINQPITFCHLLAECLHIEIPLIQRDYAQGRETAKEVRDQFLKALHTALNRTVGDSPQSLNLDFIYGSMETGANTCFLPLDGQQRLTTLFLLHWYLAWRDEELTNFKNIFLDGQRSRFTYGVRPSSREFFDELVRYTPDTNPDEVLTMRKHLEDQSWFFLHWRLDPTIQSALVMLDAIHSLFRPTKNLFSRLVDSQRPAITFQRLPLEHFGLSDDLYIKMNARGKPLTPFETFKARFEELLSELYPTETRMLGNEPVSIAKFFETQIDTQWTNFFWFYKNDETDTFDNAAVNLLVALARVSLNPANPSFDGDTIFLRGGQRGDIFTLFHERGWLTHEFASNLIILLELWSSGGGRLSAVLPNSMYFDETEFFGRAIQDPSALDYTQLVQFGAFVFYLQYHEGCENQKEMNDWMRVVRNLALNSDIERPEEYGRCLTGLTKLLPYSNRILNHLSESDIGQVGFRPQQVREETLKAKLMLTNSAWRSRIDDAEAHGYFSGQIEFILEFSGVLAAVGGMQVTKWEQAEHERLQMEFDQYFKKAQFTFTSIGLAPKTSTGSYLWERALLTYGNYLVSIGPNLSFVTDAPSNGDSWKRFLRDGGTGKRKLLKLLWDHLDIDGEIEPQLNQIVTNASGLGAWRAAVVKHREIIGYCLERKIRCEGSYDKIYLLRTTRMRGWHAELYSYALFLELDNSETRDNLTPMILQPYGFVTNREAEPYVLLVFARSGHDINFYVESRNGQFCVYMRLHELEGLPELSTALHDVGKFSDHADKLVRLVPRSDIQEILFDLAKILRNLPNRPGK